MPIIRRIRLNILSKNDIQELENNIMKLESLAKRKEAAKNKMKEVKARRGKTVGAKGTIFSGTDGAAIPRTRARQQAKTAFDRKADADASNAIKSKDRSSASAIIKTQPFKEMLKKQDKMDKALNTAVKDVAEIKEFTSDPVAFISRMAGSNKFVRRFLKVAAVVTILHAMIMGIMKQFFGPGGAGDIRKLFKDEAASINQLDLLVKISQGKTYYSSDLRTYSHIVDNSSTKSMGAQDQLYKEINIGGDII